jgi:hypothetical protein
VTAAVCRLDIPGSEGPAFEAIITGVSQTSERTSIIVNTLPLAP